MWNNVLSLKGAATARDGDPYESDAGFASDCDTEQGAGET